MPTDEYAPTVRGGLKLKGSKPAGIEKKKKKKKSSSVPSSSEPASTSKDLTTTTTSTKPTSKEEEEEIDEEKLRELEERGGDGKTDSERAYEEMRRKRVGFPFHSFPFILLILFPFYYSNYKS